MREGTLASEHVPESKPKRRRTTTRQFAAAAREKLKVRHSQLQDLKEALTNIVPAVAAGEQMTAAVSTASRRLDELRSQHHGLEAIRESVEKLVQEFDLVSVGEDEQLDETMNRFQTEIANRKLILRKNQSTRKAAKEDLREREDLIARHTKITKAITEKEHCLRKLRLSEKNAYSRLQQLRALERQVRETRANIVRRVFNQSLNDVWGDLFLRLAPDEPFVPAFTFPEVQSGTVEVVLTTLYRSVKQGGIPEQC